MLITEIFGNLQTMNVNNRVIDFILLEWYETAKKILHKRSASGREVTMKFLNENRQLHQDDVVYENEHLVIAIDIQSCEVIVIQPVSMFDMAYVCYEIGNKHLPLFYEQEQLLIPYEAPLLRMLQAGGFKVQVERRKLLRQIKTTVSPHLHNGNSPSLFSRILQLTTSPVDAKPT